MIKYTLVYIVRTAVFGLFLRSMGGFAEYTPSHSQKFHLLRAELKKPNQLSEEVFRMHFTVEFGVITY